jgi:hypothetical protein
LKSPENGISPHNPRLDAQAPLAGASKPAPDDKPACQPFLVKSATSLSESPLKSNPGRKTIGCDAAAVGSAVAAALSVGLSTGRAVTVGTGWGVPAQPVTKKSARSAAPKRKKFFIVNSPVHDFGLISQFY